MADARHLGTEDLFYVSSSSPANPDEITNYTLVGYVINWEMPSENEQITATDKDGSAVLGGSNSYTISTTTNSKHTGDAGQEIMITAHLTRAEIYWLKTSNTTSHKQLRGVAQVTAWTPTKNNNEAATEAFTLGGVGAITRESVDA